MYPGTQSLASNDAIKQNRIHALIPAIPEWSGHPGPMTGNRDEFLPFAFAPSNALIHLVF